MADACRAGAARDKRYLVHLALPQRAGALASRVPVACDSTAAVYFVDDTNRHLVNCRECRKVIDSPQYDDPSGRTQDEYGGM